MITYVGAASTHRVPDLQLDLFPLDVDHPGSELHSDCEIVDWLEPLVCKLEQKTGLSHSYKEALKSSILFYHSRPTCIPDDDVLEKVSVGHVG